MEVKLDSFLIAPVPVTNALYDSIMNQAIHSCPSSQTPVVDISWQDAVLFCNRLSQYSGLEEVYSISADGKDVVCKHGANGYRLRRKRSGNMHVKRERLAIGMASLMRSLGIATIPMAWYMRLTKSSRIRGDFLICWGMSGSGAGICTMSKYTVLTGYSVVGVGRRRREVVEQHAVAAVILHFALMILAFVLLDPYNFLKH